MYQHSVRREWLKVIWRFIIRLSVNKDLSGISMLFLRGLKYQPTAFRSKIPELDVGYSKEKSVFRLINAGMTM